MYLFLQILSLCPKQINSKLCFCIKEKGRFIVPFLLYVCYTFSVYKRHNTFRLKSCRQICKHCNIGVFTDFKRTNSVVNPTVFAAVEVIAFSAFSSSIPFLTAITAQSDRFSIVISGWSVIIATSIPLSERFLYVSKVKFF